MMPDAKPLSWLFGLPYLPNAPLFSLAGPGGLIPWPSNMYIEFGSPIPTADYESSVVDDPMVTFQVTEQVRATMQQTVYRLLDKRDTLCGPA